MRQLAVAVTLLLSLTACGGNSAGDSTEPPSSSTPAANVDELGADGFPKGFAYPPGADVQTTAPQHTLYTLADSDIATVEKYWGPHLTSLGFEPAGQTATSGTYQRGTMTVQITWNQAGTEVRGAANVLTP